MLDGQEGCPMHKIPVFLSFFETEEGTQEKELTQVHLEEMAVK